MIDAITTMSEPLVWIGSALIIVATCAILMYFLLYSHKYIEIFLSGHVRQAITKIEFKRIIKGLKPRSQAAATVEKTEANKDDQSQSDEKEQVITLKTVPEPAEEEENKPVQEEKTEVIIHQPKERPNKWNFHQKFWTIILYTYLIGGLCFLIHIFLPIGIVILIVLIFFKGSRIAYALFNVFKK